MVEETKTGQGRMVSVSVDQLFAQRENYKGLIKGIKETLECFKDKLSSVEEMDDSVGNSIVSAAADYIFQILANDSRNLRVYGRSCLTRDEIKKQLKYEEPKFDYRDLDNGINKLLTEEPPRVQEQFQVIDNIPGRMFYSTVVYWIKK